MFSISHEHNHHHHSCPVNLNIVRHTRLNSLQLLDQLVPKLLLYLRALFALHEHGYRAPRSTSISDITKRLEAFQKICLLVMIDRTIRHELAVRFHPHGRGMDERAASLFAAPCKDGFDATDDQVGDHGLVSYELGMTQSRV